nr:UPF0676 protein C1494.01-like isoform X2 [Crassostrea gigas]
MTVIPVIDLAPYSLSVPADHVDSKVLQGIADELCKAFTTVGFVYLKNHGIPQNIVEEVFSTSKTFFEKPVEVKQEYARPVDANHGWVSLEREKLNPERPAADLKEAYNMTVVDDQHLMPVDIIPNFYDVFKSLFTSAQELGNRVLDLMSIGLNIDRSFLRDCHKNVGKKDNQTTLRSLYYPRISKGMIIQHHCLPISKGTIIQPLSTVIKRGQARTGALWGTLGLRVHYVTVPRRCRGTGGKTCWGGLYSSHSYPRYSAG